MSAARSTRGLAVMLLATAAACGLGAERDPESRMPPDVGGSGGDPSSAAPASGVGGGSTGTGGGNAGSGGSGGVGGFSGNVSLPPPTHPPPAAPDVDAILKSRCATFTMQSQLLPSNLLFVLDRSASMACNPPPITDSPSCEEDPVRALAASPSKWEITRNALERAIDNLPSDTVVGLSYFSNDDSCGVHSLPSVPLSPLDPRQLGALHASLSNVTPDGATPLVGAVVLAYSHLHEAALAGDIHGSKYVVLITDGEQSDICTDPDVCSDAADCTRVLLEDEVPKAVGGGVGIKTFVIGAPGSEPARATLSAIAKAGGTAPADCDVDAGTCHFDMTKKPRFDQALQTALGEIAGRALSCDLPLPKPSDGTIELERVNVVFSPADGSQPSVIPQDDTKGCDAGADGWQYAQNASKIRLCGPTCERVIADRGGRLDVVLGCPVQNVE